MCRIQVLKRGRWDFFSALLLRGSLFPVIWLGLEPKTYCLEGSCSIQLSYQTHFNSGF